MSPGLGSGIAHMQKLPEGTQFSSSGFGTVGGRVGVGGGVVGGPVVGGDVGGLAVGFGLGAVGPAEHAQNPFWLTVD